MKNETKQTAGQPSAISVASGNSQAPVSEEMELAVILSVVAQSTSICEVGERLRPEMFSHPDYCLVYRAMLAL